MTTHTFFAASAARYPVAYSSGTNDPYTLTHAWAAALTGDPENTVFNLRFIHDQDKGKPAIKWRGTLAAMWSEACEWNRRGYGIFATVNEMDGTGYGPDGQPIRDQSGDRLENVAAIRAHVLDLDNLSAMDNLQRAAQHNPPPAFAVQSSPGKAHVCWPVGRVPMAPEAFKTTQRKLRQFYDGDRAVIDATRVLRVPGFYHHKGAPHLVTCYSLPGHGQWCSVDTLAVSLAHINAVDEGGGRHPLGDPALATPSAEWARFALEAMPVEGMTHPEFISFTAAWKQAAWTVLDHAEAFILWVQWCARFGNESKGDAYNLKHWDSITDTELGWKSLLRQNPALNAQFMFRGQKYDPSQLPIRQAQPAPEPAASGNLPDFNGTSAPEEMGGLLMAEDCAEYFKGCVYIISENKMRTPRGMMDEARFKNAFGGPRFVINPTGAPTDDAWKAATRSNFWTVEKVDAAVLRPDRQPNEIFHEGSNRYVNAFVRNEFERTDGDVTPFLEHTAKLFPNESDREHLFNYLAHCIKYPGIKVRYALFIQSTEGAGKNPFKYILRHAYGIADGRFYSPKAKSLDEGGGKFNKFMKDALFILVD